MSTDTLPRKAEEDDERLGPSIAVRLMAEEREYLERLSERSLRPMSTEIRFMIRERMRQHPADNPASDERSAR